ncbi:MAG: hypothetical protein V1722_01575, partial [Candidatus Micrarchaeota archaeon]
DFIQTMKFKPLEVESTNYANDFSCSNTQQLCGKLSIGGGQCVRNCGDGWYYDALVGTKTGTLCDGKTDVKVQATYDDHDRWGYMGGVLLKTAENAASCVTAETVGIGAGCKVGRAWGPLGAAIGSGVGAFVAGAAADRAFDAVNSDSIKESFATNMGQLPSFIKNWQTICGYAATVEKAYSVYQTYQVYMAASGEPEWKIQYQQAGSNCLCLSPVPGQAFSGTSGWGKAGGFSSCVLKSMFLTAFSSTTQTQSLMKENIQSYNDKKKAAEDASTLVRRKDAERSAAVSAVGFDSAPVGSPEHTAKVAAADEAIIASQHAGDYLAETSKDEQLARSEMCGGMSSIDCGTLLEGTNEKLDTLADVDAWFDALCSYPFIVLGANQFFGGAIYQPPARMHLAVLNSEEKKDTFLEGVGGWVTDDDSSAVDCTDSSLTPSSGKDYTWQDWDMTSLRAYPGETRECMDYPVVRAYTPNPDEIGFTEDAGVIKDGKADRLVATFYITSEDHG